MLSFDDVEYFGPNVLYTQRSMSLHNDSITDDLTKLRANDKLRKKLLKSEFLY